MLMLNEQLELIISDTFLKALPCLSSLSSDDDVAAQNGSDQEDYLGSHNSSLGNSCSVSSSSLQDFSSSCWDY
ncbi:hypothetical protein Sjap_024286 [Stephania japonica]|uniref:Uncharacterized protein n=1 Tax=Stephania japonica TaxID=461633 RepID=A0AAP0HLC5_9MAGN